jgi:hypothetical protein
MAGNRLEAIDGRSGWIFFRAEEPVKKKLLTIGSLF